MFAKQTSNKGRSIAGDKPKHTAIEKLTKQSVEENPLWQSLALSPAGIQPKLSAPGSSDTPNRNNGNPASDAQLASTTNGITTLHPDVRAHSRSAEIHAHEAVHRAQFKATARRGDRRELELDAQAGARSILAGASYVPSYSAPPNQTLNFDPLMPDVSASADANARSLSTLQPAGDSRSDVAASSTREVGTGGSQSLRFHISVSGAGARGSVNTTTDLSVSYDPGQPIGTGVGPPVLRDPELGFGPAIPIPLYPVVIRYSRELRLTDTDGRAVTVTISSNVNFTHESWARAIAGQPLTFDTLLNLRGDDASVTVVIFGSGPLQPYYTNYFYNGISLNIQSAVTESSLMAGAGLLPFSSAVPARFVRSELTAGEQFDSLEAFLVSADAIEIARRIEVERQRREALGWFGRFLEDSGIGAALSEIGDEISALWNSLPPEVRGVLIAVGKFIVGLVLVLGIAALIVLAAPEVAFATAVLVVAAIAFAAVFAISAVSRTIESINAGTFDPAVILATALLDTVGLGGLIEAITDESIISGQPLHRSLQDRWEAGTTGILQIIATILAVRGAMGRGVPLEGGGGGRRGGELPPIILRDPPLNPIRPIEPVRPVDPLRPIEPVRPVEPIEPIEPPEVAPRYNPVGRTDAELVLDSDPMPRAGETPAEGIERARLAREEIEWRELEQDYNGLPRRPPRIDIRANDTAHHARGAHTLERHFDLPLRRTATVGERTVEGRIFGDPPWLRPENWSYKWMDEPTINETVNAYLRAHWEAIRQDLALNGVHEGTFHAGDLIGEGFFNRGMGGFGPRAAVFHQTGFVTITFEFIPGNPPSFFVVRAFPAGRGF